MDYAKLEGKSVRCFRSETGSYEGESYDGVVAGVDYDLGITIVGTENKEMMLMCIPGGSSPVKDRFRPTTDEEYKTLFNMIVESIEKGELSYKEFENLYEATIKCKLGIGPVATLNDCSFNQ